MAHLFTRPTERRPFPILALTVVLTFFLTGCFSDIKWDKVKLSDYAPEFAIPLIYQEVKLEDLVASKINPEEFYVNNEGFYEFAYKGVTVSKRLDSALKFESIVLPSFTVATVGQNNVSVTQDLPFNPGSSAELTYVVTKSNTGARLVISVTNNYNRTGTISITLPNVKKVGSSTPLNATASLPTGQSADLVFDIDNCTVDFKGSNNSSNRLTVSASINFNNGAPTAGALNVAARLNKIPFKYIEGWLGNFEYLFNTTSDINVKLFNTRYGSLADAVEFYNPQLTAVLANSTGYQCTVVTDEVYTTSEEDPTPQYIQDLNGNRFRLNTSIPGATKTALGQDGTPGSSTPGRANTAIDRTNSNVNRAFIIFGTLPNKVHYRVRISSSQTRNSPSEVNFFGFDTSHVRVNYTALLPMDGRVYRYTAIDTFKLDLPSAESKGFGRFDYAELAIKAENGFPATVYSQLYFADENQIIFDSLIQAKEYTEARKIISAAPVTDGPDYKVIAPVTGPIKKYRMTASRYNTLQAKVRYVMYVSRVAGPEGGPDPNPYSQYGFTSPQRRIRIYPDYKIKAQLGLSFGFKPSTL